MKRKSELFSAWVVGLHLLLWVAPAWSMNSEEPSEGPSRSATESEAAPSQDEKPGVATAKAKPPTGVHRDNSLMSVNFLEVDIREVLSAIAMEREINIAMTKEVAGKISVHLFHVTLEEALDAVSMAGGVRYRKEGGVYCVYKPSQPGNEAAEGLQMQVFRLNYAEMENVKKLLESMPGLKMIKVHEQSRTIMVEDTPENLKKIEALVRCVDAKPQQVLIEAKILEVTLTDDMSLGVDWEQMLGDVRIGTGGFTNAVVPSTEGVSPIPQTGSGGFGNIITGAGTKYQFTAALDALQSKTKVNTLSTPKILAIHGKAAKVQVGGQQGYKVSTTNLGVVNETIEFIDTGTILEITPYIGDEREVLLNVQPSIKSAKIELGIPVVNSTVVSTWLLARSGETVFIGGLIQDIKNRTNEQVPFLGDVPGVGLLFGRHSLKNQKSELVVLITPQIVDSELEGFSREPRDRVDESEREIRDR